MRKLYKRENEFVDKEEVLNENRIRSFVKRFFEVKLFRFIVVFYDLLVNEVRFLRIVVDDVEFSRIVFVYDHSLIVVYV